MRSIGSSLGGKKRKSSLFLSGLKDNPSDLDSEMGSEKGSAGGFESELGSQRDIVSNPSFRRNSGKGSQFKTSNSIWDKPKDHPKPIRSKMSKLHPAKKSVEDLDSPE